MTNYDFSTLNDKDFELIVKDLLNAKFDLGLQSFKVGKDKGVDLRYSTEGNNNSIVVQAKHFLNSGYPQLKHTISLKEVQKVRKLNPDRYILVTSLPLSASQKDELKEILRPFILSSNDVIGQEDLNSFLGDYKEIEKRNFKLWFSSVNVLESVFNNAIEGRTRFLMERIKERFRLFVVTKKLFQATDILKKNKLLLITGQPGVGKTTLAEIILFQFAKEGYKTFKIESILEAENVISPDENEKQIFYFDDFLGSNYLEILNGNRTETQLTTFVERIRNTPNKFLIFTTRTIILSHAIDKYEKISQSKISNNQFEIKLQDYSKLEKAEILYNHLFFSIDLSELVYDAILRDGFYKTIITHKNYTPRIVEFITDWNQINNFGIEQYQKFVRVNLNNPKEIWRHSFSRQISDLDKCFLLTLFTFKNSKIHEKALMAAYQSRLKYERNENNKTYNSNQFNETISILLNGFITSSIQNSTNSEREYGFINPSLSDFLIGYISESFNERKCIISSLVYVEQLNRFNPDDKVIAIERELQSILYTKLENSEIQILESSNFYFTSDYGYTIYIELLIKYCPDIDTDNLLLKYLELLSLDNSLSLVVHRLEYIMLNLKDSTRSFRYIENKFIWMIEKMMRGIFQYKNAVNIPVLFKKYNKSYENYIKTNEGCENIISLIKNVANDIEDSLTSERENEVLSMDDVHGFYEDIDNLIDELKEELFSKYEVEIHKDLNIEIDTNFWNEKINENIERGPINEDYDEESYFEAKYESRNEDSAIEDLFNKWD